METEGASPRSPLQRPPKACAWVHALCPWSVPMVLHHIHAYGTGGDAVGNTVATSSVATCDSSHAYHRGIGNKRVQRPSGSFIRGSSECHAGSVILRRTTTSYDWNASLESPRVRLTRLHVAATRHGAGGVLLPRMATGALGAGVQLQAHHPVSWSNDSVMSVRTALL